MGGQQNALTDYFLYLKFNLKKGRHEMERAENISACLKTCRWIRKAQKRNKAKLKFFLFAGFLF